MPASFAPALEPPWHWDSDGTRKSMGDDIKGAGVESGTGFRPFGVLGNIRSLTRLISEEPPALTFYTQRRKMPPAPQSYMFPTKSGTGQGAAPPSSAGPFPVSSYPSSLSFSLFFVFPLLRPSLLSPLGQKFL